MEQDGDTMVCNCSEGFTGDLCERLGKYTGSLEGGQWCFPKGAGEYFKGVSGLESMSVLPRGW